MSRVKLPARSKYRAVKTVVDGITFASKKEAKRYGELKLMEKAGVIERLQMQPRIELNVIEFGTIRYVHHIGHYIADFLYWENGQKVYEDCKGMKTPVYRLKKKLVKALYGIEVKET